MILLDYAAFRATPVADDPFPHVVVPHFVPPHALRAVVDDLPRLAKRGSFPVTGVTLGPAARSLMVALEGETLRGAIAEKFGLDLADAPTMRYVARSETYAGKITVLPQTFQIEPYGIALRDGSPWRKPVDRALLHRLASPAWRDLVYRYLGAVE